MLVCIIQPFAYSHYHGVYYNPKRWSMPTERWAMAEFIGDAPSVHALQE